MDDGFLAVGGTTNGESIPEVSRYDAEFDRWTVVSTLPFEAPWPLSTRLDDGSIVVVNVFPSNNGETWHRSVDSGETWERIPDGPDIRAENHPSQSLLPLPGARAFFNQVRNPSTYDANLGAWTPTPLGLVTSVGAAALLTAATPLALGSVEAAVQAPLGTVQYQLDGVLIESGVDIVGVGFSACPCTNGSIEQCGARAWGAASGTVVVSALGLSGYSREQGWWELPPDPATTTGWAAVANPDGSLFVTGGCNSSGGGGHAVRQWSP